MLRDEAVGEPVGAAEGLHDEEVVQLVVRLGVVPPHVLRAAAVAERLEEMQARPRKK